MSKFEKEKKERLQRKDKSFKGNIDKKIKKLVEKINSSPNYYTTSSCSGRIILLEETGKKHKNAIFFESHEKIKINQLKKELKKTIKKTKHEIWLKQEPPILHVVSRDLKTAQSLINKARTTGFKKSGIFATQKRFVCELMSTEFLAMPLADKGKILINDEYLKILLKVINKKLSASQNKIKKLYRNLK